MGYGAGEGGETAVRDVTDRLAERSLVSARVRWVAEGGLDVRDFDTAGLGMRRPTVRVCLRWWRNASPKEGQGRAAALKTRRSWQVL